MQVEILEPTEYIKRDYGYAAWYTVYELQPGIYDIVNPGPLPYFRSIKGIKAIVKEDNFRSHLWGSYGEYDKSKNAGRVDEIYIGFPDDGSPEYMEYLLRNWMQYHPTMRIIGD